MKALSTVFCAFSAALGLAVSASAAETIAYWPFGTNGFHDVSGNGHDLVGNNVTESDAAYMSLNPGTTTNQFLRTACQRFCQQTDILIAVGIHALGQTA